MPETITPAETENTATAGGPKPTTKLNEIFETIPCKRCGGEGRLIQYSNVNAGVCFRCGGKKWEYTRHGLENYNAYQAAVDAATIRPLSEVRPGVSIKAGQMWKYCPVFEVGPIRQAGSHSNGKDAEGKWIMEPSYRVEITLTHPVWFVSGIPQIGNYKTNILDIGIEDKIRIHPGAANWPKATDFVTSPPVKRGAR